MTAIAAAMIAHTPAARPSTPSEKLTTFIIATSPITVSTGPALVTPALGKSSVPDEGQRDRLDGDPEVHDDHRREHLSDELERRMQLEAIVQRADERYHRRGDSTPCHSCGCLRA